MLWLKNDWIMVVLDGQKHTILLNQILELDLNLGRFTNWYCSLAPSITSWLFKFIFETLFK